jgi:hypothetical protein
MTVEQIRKIIETTQDENGGMGRAFEVTFRKRTTGEIRVMRARLGMKRNLTGKGQPYNPADKQLVTAWELGKHYRNIPLDGIISLRVPDSSKHLVGVPLG